MFFLCAGDLRRRAIHHCRYVLFTTMSFTPARRTTRASASLTPSSVMTVEIASSLHSAPAGRYTRVFACGNSAETMCRELVTTGSLKIKCSRTARIQI